MAFTLHITKIIKLKVKVVCKRKEKWPLEIFTEKGEKEMEGTLKDGLRNDKWTTITWKWQ
jgi:hypothetical protein